MKLFCKHKYEPLDESYYFDYDGHKVFVMRSKCCVCGKIKKQKFW